MKQVYTCISMKSSYLIFYILLLAVRLTAQQVTLRPAWYRPLAHNASELAVDEEQNLILLDAVGNKLYKYLKGFNYDSMMVVGGAGTSGEGFIQPTQMRVPNRQKIMVLDYGNRRLVVLNTNLRVIREHSYDDIAVQTSTNNSQQYLFPASFDLAPTGELFILNTDDNSIYKFDAYGRLERAFGGAGYGSGSLFRPTDVRVSGDNVVFVPEPASQHIQVFDNFGTYQYRLSPTLAFTWQQVRPRTGQVLLFNDMQVALYELKTGKQVVFTPVNEANIVGGIVDVEPRPEGVYILRKNGVFLYSF